MGNIHHANAKTTARVRKEIQESNEKNTVLASRYHVNIKTIIKWKAANGVEDRKSGPRNPKSTVLTELEENIICEFRRLTKFSLDDVFIVLKDKIPALTRSNLHRCLVRNNLSRLPKEEGKERTKKPFKSYDIGYVHIDISELRTEEGKAYMFVAIERATKYVYAEIYTRMTQDNAQIFLQNTIKDCPFKIHTILTDNGSQFTYQLLAEHLRPKDKVHPFDEVCKGQRIEHRLTRFRHPWTNGQVEVMNRVIKSHTVKKFHYTRLSDLKRHLMSFLLLYNYQKKLKSLKHQTPYYAIIKTYEDTPTFFKENPNLKNVGLNT